MSKYSDNVKRRKEIQPRIDQFVSRVVEKFKARMRANACADRAAKKYRTMRRDKFEEQDRKRIDKYNARRAVKRHERRNSVKRIDEITDNELIVVCKRIEKMLDAEKRPKLASAVAEIARRFSVSIGLSKEVESAILSPQ